MDSDAPTFIATDIDMLDGMGMCSAYDCPCTRVFGVETTEELEAVAWWWVVSSADRGEA